MLKTISLIICTKKAIKSVVILASLMNEWDCQCGWVPCVKLFMLKILRLEHKTLTLINKTLA